MSYYFFDNPTSGIVFAILVEFILILTWIFLRERTNPLTLLAGPVIAALFLLGDFLVETNREKVEKTVRQLCLTAEQENANAFLALLSQDIKLPNRMGKDQISARIREFFAHPLIAHNRINQLQVKTMDQQQAQVELNVTTTLDDSSQYIAYTPVLTMKWQLDFARDDDNIYRLTSAIMTSLNNTSGVDVFTYQ